MPQENILRFKNWSGGLSDSVYRGIEGSFAKGTGLDIHSEPGLLKVNQKLKKDSGTIVLDLVKFQVKASDGNNYFFGDTGKIYKRTVEGVWSTPQVNANGGCLGAEEHKDYIYYASATKLGRFGPLSGSPTWTDSWATFLNGNTVSHFMLKSEKHDELFICDGKDIACVDDTSTFLNTVLDLKETYVAKFLIPYDINILIGADNGRKTRLFWWDGVDVTWMDDKIFSQTPIQLLMDAESYIVMQLGNYGKFYYFDGSNKGDLKQIPGSYSKTKTLKIHSGAADLFQGHPFFGISNKEGNPALQGVYSWRRHNKNYPYVLNLEYVISQNKLASIEIGCVKADGDDLYVSWKDGSTYGVDIIDFDNKYNGAYLETLLINPSREWEKTFTAFPLTFRKLSAGCSLKMYAKTDYATDWGTVLGTVNTTDAIDDGDTFRKPIPAVAIQLKIEFGTSGNNAPEVEELDVLFILSKFLH